MLYVITIESLPDLVVPGRYDDNLKYRVTFNALISND